MQLIRYIVLTIIFASILHGLLASIWVFLKPHGNQKANVCLGLLLLTFSMGTFNVLLLRTRVFGDYDHLYYAPLWYTLSYGPLFFYYVKFSLFPTYEARATDLKHFLLPAIQLSVILFVAFQPESYKNRIWENFIQPIYGPIEYTLFLVFLFIYVYLAYRYIRFKIVTLRMNSTHWERKKAFDLRLVIRRLIILGTVYSFFAISDFIAFHGFGVNMYEVNGFGWLGDLAFAGMLTWLAVMSYWQDLLVYVRVSFSQKQIDFTNKALDKWIKGEERFRNADLTISEMADAFDVSRASLHKAIQQKFKQNFRAWLSQYRLAYIQRRLAEDATPADLTALVWQSGFHSKGEHRKAIANQ